MGIRYSQLGIGVLGLFIVLLLAGLATAGFTPMLMSKQKRATEDSDRAALEAAKNAIIGYAMSNGRLPTPDPATTNCPTGVMPTNLGVNNWGRFGPENPFCLDTSDALRATAAAKSLCNAARAQLATPAAPYSGNTPVAFVLFSTGNDRAHNQGTNIANAGVPAEHRHYQADNRGIDDSAGANRYDDQVLSYPLSSLLAECGKLGGAPVCNLTASASSINLGQSLTLTASCSNNPNCQPSTYTWASTPSAPALLPTTSNSITSTPSTAATYLYSVAACNEFQTGAQSLTVAVVVNAAGANIASLASFSDSGGNGFIGGPSSRLADGIVTWAIQSFFWHGKTGASLTSTFPAPKTINRVVLYFVRDDYLNAAQPSASETCSDCFYTPSSVAIDHWNGTGWVQVASVTNNKHYLLDLSFASVETDRIRTRIVSASSWDYALFTEIQVYGN